jgi:hypothetical protein
MSATTTRQCSKLSGGFSFAGYDFDAAPYRLISNVEARDTATVATVVVTAVGSQLKLVATYSNRDEVQTFLRVVSELVNPKPPIELSTAASAPPSLVADEVRELAKLRDEGLLTEDQFESKKRHLLGLD